MQYCADKYGADKVAQIITFGTLGARAAVRDVGRVMNIPLNDVDRVSKLIPNVGKALTIPETLDQINDFKTIYNESSELKELIDTAAKMEGVVRNAGTHAAGVVISDEPIISYLPLHRPTSQAEDTPIKSVTQFEMSIIENQGLLKVDFLGLITLTVMQRACDLIEQRHGVRYTLSNIPIDDPATFEFLSKGHTAGVFQLEGNGMTRFLVQMRPQNLDNVIAMVALYRPGPLDFIPSYIKRMHGEEPVEYRHPALEPIFNETFGIPVYQEQIMRAAVDMGGYSMAASDELRKAISKKQKDKIEKHKLKFIEGCVKNGIARETAEGIFADWEEFARYGFNKAHATDYGVIAVQTAYLKAHYTAEYMTALLSASKNDTAKVAFYVADCRAMGIEVLPPDINAGGWDFTIEERDGKPSIRFGLGAVKNVGQAPVDLILQARAEGGEFTSLNDFATRIDLRQVGKRSLECLVKVGALEMFGSRHSLLEALDKVLSVSTSHFRAAQSGQLSFFGGGVVEDEITLPAASVSDNRQQLEWERELIGLYVSSHPLTPYLPALKRKVTHNSSSLSEARPKEIVRVAGLVTKFRNFQTKAGKAMGFVTLEDMQGSIELVVFPSTWDKYHQLVANDAVLVAEGKADVGQGDPKVLVDKLSEASLEDPGDDFGEAFGFDGLSYYDDEEMVFTPPPSTLRKVAEQLLSAPPKAGEPSLRALPLAELQSTAPPPPAPLPLGEGRVRASTPSATPPAPSDPLSPAEGRLRASTPSTTPPPSDPLPPGEGRVRAARDPLEPPEEPPDWHLYAAGLDDFAPVDDEIGPPAPARSPAVSEKPASHAVREPAAPLAAVPAPVQPPVTAPVAAAEAKREKLSPPEVPPVPVAAPFLVSPLVQAAEGQEPRMLALVLRSTGDKVRDIRRLRVIVGKLHSFPGQDRFSFLVFEHNHNYLLDFPNDTTCICSPLLSELSQIVGEENVRVEPIRIH